MKWILLLIVLIFLAGIIALRYRRQINFLILLWKQLKTLNSKSNIKEKKIETNRSETDKPLERCVRCGNWVVQSNIMRLGGANYCSITCLEKNVRN